MSLADIMLSPIFVIGILTGASALFIRWYSYNRGYIEGVKAANTIWREHNKRCRQQRYNTLMDSGVQDKLSGNH